MKKKNDIASLLALSSKAVPFVMLLSSCGRSDEHIWAFGAYFFLIYSLALLVVLFLPRLHQLPIFHQIAEKIGKPVSILAIIISFLGASIALIGIFKFFGDYGPEKLTFFLGTIILVLGRYLYLWAKTSSPREKTTYAKIVTLSLSFIIGLIYIMGGAEAVNLKKIFYR